MYPVVAREELADKMAGTENAQADRGMNIEVNRTALGTQTSWES